MQKVEHRSPVKIKGVSTYIKTPEFQAPPKVVEYRKEYVIEIYEIICHAHVNDRHLTLFDVT